MRKHLAAELVAAFDRSSTTQPWTYYISHYVPWPVALGAYVALAAWLPWHFWHAYLRAHRAKATGGR